MSEFSEGMAVGQSLGQNNGNGCYQPAMPMVPAYGGYGGMNGFGNGDGWWILLLLLCGWGNGNNGWNNGGGNFLGYELGRVATTNDVASGFNNSAVLSSLNDLKLGQSQGFASVQQTLCQGFSGINQTVMNGFHGVDNAVCNLGYQTQAGFNDVSRQISDCCCNLGRAIDGVNYNMAKNTCDIIQAGHNDTQRLLDYWNCKELAAKDLQISQLTAQLSQNSQTATLLNAINRTPVAAYVVQNPYCCNNNPCCGC